MRSRDRPESKGGEVVSFRPDIISWNLTRRCNLNCAHCYLDADFRCGTRADELTTRECIEVVEQIAEVNPGALLILTGGEPLLRRDVFGIAEHASRRGLLVTIGTNGTPLTPGLVRRLAAAGVRGVSISLHAPRAGTHDAFTGVAGSWGAAVRGAQTLREAHIPFIIQTSVMPWNCEEVPAMADLACRLGARVFNLYFLICTGRGERVTDLSTAQRETMLVRLYELQKAFEGRMGVRARCAPQYQRVVSQAEPQSPHLLAFTGGCPAATHYCRITPTGDLTPCPYLPLAVGNLRRERFAHLWPAAPLLRELRDRSRLRGRCGRCEFQVVCGGCRARAYAEGQDYLAEDPGCAYEPGRSGAEPAVQEPARTYGLEAAPTLPWTPPARARLESVPRFVRGMVVKGVERYARERGYATVTPEVLMEAREKLVGTAGPRFGVPLQDGEREAS